MGSEEAYTITVSIDSHYPPIKSPDIVKQAIFVDDMYLKDSENSSGTAIFLFSFH